LFMQFSVFLWFYFFYFFLKCEDMKFVHILTYF
jgi:hypothetical protein